MHARKSGKSVFSFLGRIWESTTSKQPKTTKIQAAITPILLFDFNGREKPLFYL